MVDTDDTQPSISRVFNYYLGGGSNLNADRGFARRVETILPDASTLAAASRQFLARALRYCLARGVRQVIDIGAGIPTHTTTHHIAHAVDPSCRVVYVDNESVAVHAIRHRITSDPRLGVLGADARDVRAVLDDRETTRVLDLSQPVALIMSMLIHFIPDHDAPARMIQRYTETVAPGSFLIISHDTADGREHDMEQVAEVYAEMNRPLILRTHTNSPHCSMGCA